MNLLEVYTRDSRLKANNDNVETVKDVNNTAGSPKEKRCFRVDRWIYTRFRVKISFSKNLHGIPVVKIQM